MADDKKKEPVDEKKMEKVLRFIFEKPKADTVKAKRDDAILEETRKRLEGEKKDGGQNSDTRDTGR